MKKQNGIIFALILVLVVIAVIIVAALMFKSSDENVVIENTVSITDFKTKLQENGLNITDEIEKSADVIGAEEGYGYTIEGSTIEIYKFDLNSEEAFTKSNIENAKKEGKITILTAELRFEAKYNKGLVLINYQGHPQETKILEIFNSL